MKKLFVLSVMALIGISVVFSNVKADEARTIPFKYGSAISARTLIVGRGGTLHKISGIAASANAIWSIHDYGSIADSHGGTKTRENILAEGGEATQYDAIGPIDFGEEGLPFVNGLVVVTTTADIAVTYR